MKPLKTLAAASTALFLTTSAGHATFTLLENFDGLTPGGLNGQNGWTAHAAATVVEQSPGDNAASLLSAANAANYKALPAAIPNSNSSTTVYFNLSFSAATGNNFNAIVTDAAAPGNTNTHSEVQLNTDNSAPAGGVATFRANSGNSFLHLSTGQSADTAVPLVADSLYNVWFVINNVTDLYQVWMQNDSVASIASGPTQLFHATPGGIGDFTFRNSGGGPVANDLVTFNFGSGSTTSTFRIDDIYVDIAGVNLVNPIPEPAVVILGLIGVAGTALRRRRQA